MDSKFSDRLTPILEPGGDRAGIPGKSAARGTVSAWSPRNHQWGVHTASGQPEKLATDGSGKTHIPIVSPKVSRSWTDGWEFLAKAASRAASWASVVFLRVLRRF
jgi:hypothetical protein